jgi:RNA-directed DNA polymerase
MQKKLKEIKDELKKRMHDSIQEIGQWLKAVVTGHYRYYGVPGNYEAMNDFRYQIARRWKHSLRRRSQKATITWDKMGKLIDRWIPKPKILHKYPSERFGVTI